MWVTCLLAKLYNSLSGTPPLVVIRLRVTITMVTTWKHVSIWDDIDVPFHATSIQAIGLYDVTLATDCTRVHASTIFTRTPLSKLPGCVYKTTEHWCGHKWRLNYLLKPLATCSILLLWPSWQLLSQQDFEQCSCFCFTAHSLLYVCPRGFQGGIRSWFT